MPWQASWTSAQTDKKKQVLMPENVVLRLSLLTISGAVDFNVYSGQ